MKISKRTLIMVISLVLAMSVTAFGTIAYMTDRASVTNTFTIGGIDIEMDETEVDEDGNPTNPDPDQDDDGKPEVDLDGDGEPDIEIEVTPDGDIIITPIDPDRDPIVINPSNPDPSLPDVDNDGKPEIDVDGDDVPDIEVEVDPDDGDIIITPIDPDGKPTDDPIVVDPTPDEPGRTDENDYKMIPGKVYTKDPTITVKAGSEECYVRMRVRINKLDALWAIIDKHPDEYANIAAPEELLFQFIVDFNEEDWQYIDCEEVTDEFDEVWMEYDFWHMQPDADDAVKVNAETETQVIPLLFDQVKVPEWFNNEDLQSVDGFKMNVWGDAIQTESFTDATEAWAAFDKQIFNKDTNQE